MRKHTSIHYDWSVVDKINITAPKNHCKFVLPKKLIRLAVLRNRIKRIVRHSATNKICCYFKIKTSVTKKNCKAMIAEIKESLYLEKT
jgi:ribonuclease P protein component